MAQPPLVRICLNRRGIADQSRKRRASRRGGRRMSFRKRHSQRSLGESASIRGRPRFRFRAALACSARHGPSPWCARFALWTRSPSAGGITKGPDELQHTYEDLASPCRVGRTTTVDPPPPLRCRSRSAFGAISNNCMGGMELYFCMQLFWGLSVPCPIRQ